MSPTWLTSSEGCQPVHPVSLMVISDCSGLQPMPMVTVALLAAM